ncbi:hypothetical protein COL940_004164 [Colletotrichum noveboracense]|nr:hypothetical protein COL940_004164 [Colletotrichum noveboracense]
MSCPRHILRVSPSSSHRDLAAAEERMEDRSSPQVERPGPPRLVSSATDNVFLGDHSRLPAQHTAVAECVSRSPDGALAPSSPRDRHYVEPIAGGGEDEAHIVGPADIEDTQILSTYLSNDSSVLNRGIRTRISGTSPRQEPGGSGRKPVVFTTVRKQPLGVPNDRTPAFLKCQVIEKLLEPLLPYVVEL